jgi:hypothetical protein
MYVYDVKVRGVMYLWGSDGIAANFSWPLLLSVRNDVAGDPVTISTETVGSSVQSTIGTLQPGQCYTIPLLGLKGVSATCQVDANVTSNVTCALLLPQLAAAP